MSESNSKSKARRASRQSKPQEAATGSKTPAKRAARATAGASAAKPRNPVGTSRDQGAGKPTSRVVAPRTGDQRDWREETLARMRALILEAEPRMTEERKWRKPSNAMTGVPVWSHNGIVCTGETYKEVVKLTFARGASLPDPMHLFNSSLEGNTRRAIDIRKGEKIVAAPFKALIKAAVALNAAQGNDPKPGASETKPTSKASPKGATKANSPVRAVKPIKAGNRKKVVLLSGGNPQIAKAEGAAPVEAYIAAMPGWKCALGTRLDALIMRNVPDLRKAVKWNSPFYGVDGQGWFLSFHVFTRYVKVTFFRGTALQPVPPGGTGKDARWIDIGEDDHLDETQFATWVKQAAALPGWLA